MCVWIAGKMVLLDHTLGGMEEGRWFHECWRLKDNANKDFRKASGVGYASSRRLRQPMLKVNRKVAGVGYASSRRLRQLILGNVFLGRILIYLNTPSAPFELIHFLTTFWSLIKVIASFHQSQTSLNHLQCSIHQLLKIQSRTWAAKPPVFISG